MFVQLEINAVAGTTEDPDRSMLLLKETKGDRILPVMMSTRRALTLMMRSRVPFQLPMAASVPDAANLLMQKFGIHVTRVEITAIKDAVFFCRVVAEREGEEKELEFCPAPDGLVLATTALCPIVIDEQLLEAQYLRRTGTNSFALNINSLTRQMLEDALQHAIDSENYEAASQLRDELARRTPA